ncbi:unnamed protein product [Allacma fusca]|uniref:Uncharacterized protein n=1 Tax=Allacma fusca TaxID=39272 RepID=A0A8J2MF24_9HEXA|nr:unnamed protein product [Allacma fusca]
MLEEVCQWSSGCWDCITMGNKWVLLLDKSQCCVRDLSTIIGPAVQKVGYKLTDCADASLHELMAGLDLMVLGLGLSMYFRWCRRPSSFLRQPFHVKVLGVSQGLDMTRRDKLGFLDDTFYGVASFDQLARLSSIREEKEEETML